MITLAQAAAMTGMARSSILRAIKRGALSGTRQDDGTWLVDPAELARAFPVNAQAPLQRAHSDPVAAVKLEAAHVSTPKARRQLRPIGFFVAEPAVLLLLDSHACNHHRHAVIDDGTSKFLFRDLRELLEF